jgi:hypothetical protein
MDRHLDTLPDQIIRAAVAPFAAGDSVVMLPRPGAAITVFDIRQLPSGQWRVRAGNSERDFVDAPAERFAPAPQGYRGPPSPPTGSAAAGLSYRAWQDKQADDDADLTYQAALCSYHKQMIDWATVHAARVNPAAGREAVQTHTFMLSRAMSRLAGRDPDAISVGEVAA